MPKVPTIGSGKIHPVRTAVDPEQADDTSFLPVPALPAAQQPGVPQSPEVDLPVDNLPTQNLYGALATTDADRNAKVISIAQKSGQPEAFVDRHLPAFEKAAGAPSPSFFAELEAQYPGTQQFLVDPKNMAVSHDDMPNLAQHEELVQHVTEASSWTDAFLYGLESSSGGLAARRSLPDLSMPKDPSLAESLSAQAGGLLGDVPAMIAGGFMAAPAGATAGAIAGSPAGLPGIAGGAALGATGAAAAGAMALPAALKTALEQKYRDGHITSYSDVLKEAVKQGFVGLATAGAGGLAAKVVGGRLAPLAAEIATMTTAGKAVEGQTPTPRDFLESALLVGALHGATHSAEGLHGILQERKAQAAKDFYTSLGNTAEASKLRERLPDAHRELVTQLTKDGPVENVYVPVEAAEQYFQSKKIDPAAVMDELGAGQAYQEAKATGGDIKIPLATWTDKFVGTEHYHGLAEDIKFDPEDLTTRQVATRKAEIAEQVRQAVENQKAVQAATEKLDQVSSVYQTIQEQLKAAGLSKPETEFNPQLHEAFLTTMGQHLGVAPEELAKRFPLDIQRRESPELQPSLPSLEQNGEKVLDQGAPKIDEVAPRGRIRIGKEGYAIDLFKNADRSTFLHETGHYFLDVMGKIASDENTPKQVKADYQTILDWLGVKSRDEIASEHHEQFARGFERYLMEGSAPSSALQRAFYRFRKWLTNVYKHARNLNVEISDDVRAVMDRMLSSESHVDDANKIIGITGEKIPGLPPEVEARIHDLQSQARDRAESALVKTQMEELSAKHREFLDKERAKQTDIAKDQVDELPVFKAGEEAVATIGKDRRASTIAEKFLAEKLKSADAAQFEALAEIHGFPNGEEMAKAMILADEGKLYAREVEARVNAAMEPHASLMDRYEIRAEALKAVHNEKTTELLALERQALEDLVGKTEIKQEISKRSKLEARIEAEVAKETAREILSNKTIKDSANARTYITSERNAAVNVAKALARKDYEAAANFKRQQMLNHALATEAMRNKVEANKALRVLTDFAKRKSDLKDMPFGFVRQIDQLLSRFGLTDARAEDLTSRIATAKDLAAKGEDTGEIANQTGLKVDAAGNWAPESLTEFVARVNDSYYALTLPDSVLSGGRESFQDLTLGELRDLRDAASAIAKTGRNYNRFLSAFERSDIKEAGAAFRAAVEEGIGTPYAEGRKIGRADESGLRSVIKAIGHFPDSLIPSMVNMATLVKYLDRGANDGIAHDHIYRPLKQAEDRKFARYQKMTKEIEDLFGAHYEPKELAAYKSKASEKFFPEIGRNLRKEEVLSMALNWGNEGNRDRIRTGYSLTDARVESVLASLGKKDWDFAQAVWDHLDSYWPEISALEMRVRGIEPGRVEPSAILNEHGTYRGGYYPISYDYEKSSEAYQNAEQKNELYKQFSSTAAHTDRGHAKERVTNVARPVRLSLDVLFNHLENVVHDLEFREPIIDVNRFLRNHDVRTALENGIGVNATKAIGDWLKANGSDQGEALNFADKAFQWTRFSTTLSTLGFTPKAFLLHLPSNVFNSAWEIGAARTAKMLTSAMMEHVMGEGNLKDFVFEKSERMKQRMTVRDRDIMDMSRKWSGTAAGFIPHYAFMAIHFADEAVSIPLWAEVYKSNLEAHGEAKAKALADEAVTRTLGSGTMVDRIGAQRGGGLKKLFTMFYSWMSVMFNRAWLDGKIAGLEYNEGNVGNAAAIMAKATFFAWLLPAAHEALLAESMRNAPPGNDDERNKRMIGKFIEHPFAYMLIARDIAPPLVHIALGERPGGAGNYQMSPIEQAFQNLILPAGEAVHIALSDKHADQKFAEDAARGMAQLTGTPQQLNSWAFNLLDYANHNGEASWRDFLSRRKKK